MITPKPGKSFDPALIPKAVKDAGFSAPEVTFTATGRLEQEGSALLLSVPGLRQPFRLSGGEQWSRLEQRTELLGKPVKITGKLQPAKGKAPPGMSVESFRVPPP